MDAFFGYNYTHSCSHLSRFDLLASFCKLFPLPGPNFGCSAVDFVSLLRRGKGGSITYMNMESEK